MIPSTQVVEAPPESEVQKEPASQPQVRESRPKLRDVPLAQPKRPARIEGSFQSSMLEYNHMEGRSRFVDVLISLAVNTSLLITPIFLGLYFTDTLWPDFRRADLLEAILEYQKRDRRFGGVKADVSSPAETLSETVGVPIR